MFDFEAYLRGVIRELKDEGRYRTFVSLSKIKPPYVETEFGLVTNWCSNDYLGMSVHPKVCEAAKSTLEKRGVGAGGTRNIAGTHPEIIDLENTIKEVTEKESSLVFSSGYAANEAALAALGRVLPNCVFFSDEENHASMIRGMAASKAKREVFRHNDVNHLRELLSAYPSSIPKIVVFESVYSMSGSFGDLVPLIETAKEFGALVYVDETHGVGLYGEKGAGLCQELGVLEFVDVIQGGLGKGYGVIGGFIAGSSLIVDTVRSFGSAFIFTTALPPMVCAAANASVLHLSESQTERALHRRNVKILKEKLKGLSVLKTPSHIVPVMIRDSFLCKQISDRLLKEFKIYIQPINYPTVPRGEERLRITPTPLHSDADIDHLVSALRSVLPESLQLAA